MGALVKCSVDARWGLKFLQIPRAGEMLCVSKAVRQPVEKKTDASTLPAEGCNAAISACDKGGAWAHVLSIVRTFVKRETCSPEMQ